jgi:outer membrane protein OmpA-like peptidoglycan-associated protein
MQMMRYQRAQVVGLALVILGTATASHAQLGRALRDRVQQRLQKKDEPPREDQEPPQPEPTSATAPAPSAPASEQAAATPAAAASPAATLRPGEGAWANYDFVPGDRILFAEDFTADRVGNFPRRLTLEKGTFEVVEWSGRRWLRSSNEGEFTVTLPQALPERWTMEFEVMLPSNGIYIYPGPDTDQYGGSVQAIHLAYSDVHVNVPGKAVSSVDPRVEFGEDIVPDDTYLSRPFHVRVQADGAYMKVYLDEKRLANVPNVGRFMGNALHFYFRENTANGTVFAPLLTALTINAGGAELYDALMAGGRLAVPGIYFDTGSDRIRPESSGTLAEIQQMLTDHKDLRLTVEGHTDNVGVPATNQALSERRAAAVVTYLTGRGVDASRLRSAGFGDTKPTAPNDSAEGRQKNRRVELVVAK